ncbi:TPA: hypothetical protein ACKE3D_001219 [Burkholderia dolosa]
MNAQRHKDPAEQALGRRMAAVENVVSVGQFLQRCIGTLMAVCRSIDRRVAIARG